MQDKKIEDLFITLEVQLGKKMYKELQQFISDNYISNGEVETIVTEFGINSYKLGQEHIGEVITQITKEADYESLKKRY